MTSGPPAQTDSAAESPLAQIPRSVQNALRIALWPLAIGTFLHRLLILVPAGAMTNDYAPVFRAIRSFINSEPVYTANYNSVEPHYLYSPGGSLVLSIFGLGEDFSTSRLIFVWVNAVAILLALALLLRIVRLPLSSPALPAAIWLAFMTESVTNTLVFSNINGVVLLCEVAFIGLLLRRADAWAGLPLGLALVIKPILLPLLFLPLVQGRWRVLLGAVGIPAVITAIAWPLGADSREYLNRTLPYMREVRDHSNSSLPGIGTFFGAPAPLTLALEALVLLGVALTLFHVWRYRHSDQRLWLLTGSGVILAGVFLVSSLGQMYYSMLLFPALASVVLMGNLVRTIAAWVAVYLFLSIDSWSFAGADSVWLTSLGRTLEALRPTLGWFLFAAALAGVALWREARLLQLGQWPGLDGHLPPDTFADNRPVSA